MIRHILCLPTDIFNVYPATVKFKTYQARWEIQNMERIFVCILINRH
ncbi:hypothetical protein GMD01_10030 [[Ruminococcus] torques]|nr:hypothetical protein [[Ruminococcus] torques]MTQ78381.1 hypothetical protein [[Ruminococcus] torques]MTQ84702.1 hypothetical protein [[Ruminococcus] torques]MTR59119.1 hypothetical protein [[Ruminococcus] torques]MTS75655.1 hypothetical protein [[Ruminococcus] torques]